MKREEERREEMRREDKRRDEKRSEAKGSKACTHTTDFHKGRREMHTDRARPTTEIQDTSPI